MKSTLVENVLERGQFPESVRNRETSPESTPDQLASIAPNSPMSTGVVVGLFVSLDEAGEPIVDFPSNLSGRAIRARSIVRLAQKNAGQEVVLQFEDGDLLKPIVMGLLQRPESTPPSSRERPLTKAKVHGENLLFTAETEIVLRCGSASITLTRAGKILLRGTYVLSRSTGVNRINGASVQIN